ncbi:MAG: hypothetical protein AB8B96_20160 [Lysobacterales bacterium]
MIGEGTLALLLVTSLPQLTLAGPDYPLQVPGEGALAMQAVFRPQLSADGRFVLFATASDEFDPADNNGLTDFYRLDRRAGSYERVSGSATVQGNSSAARGVLSADGRVVAFHSGATNLTADAGNSFIDVFLWQAGQELEQISIGLQAAPANGSSLNPALSGDGRYVAFSSFASNLVVADDNESSDIFVHDRQSAMTQRVSLSSAGQEGDRGSFQPTISVDGRYVAFTSEATNFSDNEFDQLPDLFVFDRSTGTTQLVNQSTNGVRANADSATPVLSPDGSAVAFYSRATTLEAGFENVFFDVFVRDFLSLQTDLVSAAPDEPADANSFNPAISIRGEWVAFQSEAANLSAQDGNTFSDIYVVNRFSGQSHIASRRATGTSANEGSFAASITSDGSAVSFESAATDLTPTGSAVTSGYLAVGPAGAVDSLAVLPPPGQELSESVEALSISTDGRYAALVTSADNVLPGVADSNGQPDAFLLDLRARQVRLLSRAASGGFVGGADGAPTFAVAVSDDGCKTLMGSAIDAAQLGVDPVIVDGNNSADLFLRDDCSVGPLRVGSLTAGAVETGSLPSIEPTLSADGQWVVFVSAAEEFQDLPGPQGVTQIFRQPFNDASDRQLISAVQGRGADFSSRQPRQSADGLAVVFVSAEPRLDSMLDESLRPAPGLDQVYRLDVPTGRIELLSTGFVGGVAGAPNGASFQPSISADGATVVFASVATNLTSAGTLPGQRLFVWRDDSSPAAGVSPLPATLTSPGVAQHPELSPDGNLLAFNSDDPDLVVADNNARSDVFVTDLVSNDVVAVGRQSDGGLNSDGALQALGVSRQGKTYQAAYLALTNGITAVRFQPVIRSVPATVIDFSIESPLQSVERGHFRLQVRNTGAVPIGADEQVTVTLDPLSHPLVDVGNTPRWRCSAGPPVICEFVGDAVVGDEIPPGGAEMLTFEFDMFAGTEPLVSGALLTTSNQPLPLATAPALTTQRVQSGVFVQPQSSAELAPGVTGVAQISVINGGQQTVSQITVDLAPLVVGEPFHIITPRPGDPWACLSVDDPELSPLTTRCTYDGPPLGPNEEVLLSSPLILPPGVGRLLTRVSAASDAEVISPATVQLMVTEVPGLIFRGSFEG